jgi:hypothetical protein
MNRAFTERGNEVSLMVAVASSFRVLIYPRKITGFGFAALS